MKGRVGMDLSGFKAFDFSEGIPYFSVTKNGLTFSKAVTLKLGCPAYARLYAFSFNPVNRNLVGLWLRINPPRTPQTGCEPTQSAGSMHSIAGLAAILCHYYMLQRQKKQGLDEIRVQLLKVGN